MQEITALLSIGSALFIGAISPGPSFVMVAKTAVTSGRINGLCTALGMGLGGFVFAALSLLGLNGLLLAVPALYLFLKIAGGLYLAYLGLKIWHGAKQALAMPTDGNVSTDSSYLNSAITGATTQLSNPKTAIVYASVFATFLPALPSVSFSSAIVLLVFAIEAGWYSLFALALSSEAPRKQYLRYKTAMDRVAGGVMMVLGLKLATAAGR
ncbi:LysE family translocator [Aquitalea aquatica]|uniref:LysE family translocator n=1 Tax=Aquitalea aquatica TaxID=3044273 RepID=A0A838Y794_9NEIS|nr:LysE family translocator [Aquitalea magnusonii]MBA4708449.1 LysE family translocator [Aquitalea magnusonii]